MFDVPVTDNKPVPLPISFTKGELIDFVGSVYAMGASDIKFQASDFVWADINRIWVRVSERRLESDEVRQVLAMVNDASAIGLLGSGDAVDDRAELFVDVNTSNEFRLNATACLVGRARDGLALTLRSMPKEIPTLAQLGIEHEIRDELFPRYGLILVVGTTGSGKSTLLAAANRERLESRRHDPVAIGTYENPIEYRLNGLAQGHMPEPVQMQLGRGGHLREFSQVGPNAMRRRFDVIVMGEIRDRESAEQGLELAQTGHATYATMHVDTPGEAISRMVKLFPAEARDAVASSLLDRLKLVVAQKLARKEGRGKVAFRSWVVFDRDFRRVLDAEPTARWASLIDKRVESLGADFPTSAHQAYVKGLITLESFREVSGFTAAEARNYIETHGARNASVVG